MFILLIFVLLTANFATNPGFEVDLPAAAHSTPVERARLILSLDERGRVWLDRRLVEWGALPRELQALDPGRLGVAAVRADRRRPFEEVIRLLDALKGAGFEQVSLSVSSAVEEGLSAE